MMGMFATQLANGVCVDKAGAGLATKEVTEEGLDGA